MKKRKIKVWLIPLISIVLVAAIGVGIWAVVGKKNAAPVYVYEFNMVGMTEYWGDTKESYGPVSTDRIQTVFPSDTLEVIEILVAQGDQVKKGDILLRYDTTLTDITLERKRLEVEKARLAVEEAQERLREIRSMKPMVIPQPDQEGEVDLGPKLSGQYQLSTNSDYDGSSKDKALICWLGNYTMVDNALLEAIRVRAEEYQVINANKPPQEGEGTPEGGEGTPEGGEGTPEGGEGTPEGGEGTPEGGEGEPEPIEVKRFYVIFKVTEGDQAKAVRSTWQGLAVNKVGGSFTFQFFDAFSLADHQLQEFSGEEQEKPEVDYGSGYTAFQIGQMKAEQEEVIKDKEKDLHLIEAEYEILQREMGDGNVYAEIDGVVVSLIDPEEAKMTFQPILKVSDGGGYYVEGTVSELQRDLLTIGQEVTVNDWNTGMMYTGQVVSIADFPGESNYFNGMDNPNASYYPFQVFVDGSADLQAGAYVSIMFSAATSENGLYLENPYVRTEQGVSFVYVQGSDGRLEKRIVTLGKSLWGSYTEILSGLTAQDLIAFPYGKGVKEGVPTVVGDYSTMYE